MDLTSDQTSTPASTPVHTSDQTLGLQAQRRPDRPHLSSRAYMHPAPSTNRTALKTMCGRYGQTGHTWNCKGFSCPDLDGEVGTVGTVCMFHANRRRGWGAARVLPRFVGLRVARPQFVRIFCVPNLVPVGTRGRA